MTPMMKRVLVMSAAAVLCVGVEAGAQHGGRSQPGAPARDEYQKPAEVITALALKPGAVVADIGTGGGYFLVPLSKAVGPTGRVIGIDVDGTSLTRLNRRLRDEGIANASTILAEEADPLLLPQSVDTILIVNVWHHIGDRRAYARLLARALRPGGRVAVVDFHKRDLPVGPPPARKLTREEELADFVESGYRLVAEHTFLPYQYFLVFEVQQ